MQTLPEISSIAITALLAIRRELEWPGARLSQGLGMLALPTINSMAATGVVSLPGMMTRQILGGVQSVEAVKYQVLVMFLIAGSTGLGAVTAVLGGVYHLMRANFGCVSTQLTGMVDLIFWRSRSKRQKSSVFVSPAKLSASFDRLTNVGISPLQSAQNG